jgi:L-ascorbate metabolism protein UlaG (beta-lactamase superfamily)
MRYRFVFILCIGLAAAAWGADPAEEACGKALAQLASGDAAARSAALAYFEIHPDPRALPGLTALLNSPDAKVRRGALRAVGFSGDLKGAPAVAGLLSDPDPGVRLSAVFALMRLRALGDFANARGLADDAEPLMRLAVAGVRTLFGLEDRQGELMDALRGKEYGPVSVAAPALAMIGRPEDVQAVTLLLGHEQDEFRHLGAQALQDAADPALVLGPLMAALERETYFYVEQALARTAALQGMKNPEAFAGPLAASARRNLLLAEAKLFRNFDRLDAALAAGLRPTEPGLKERLRLLEASGGAASLEVIRRLAAAPEAPSPARAEAMLVLGRMNDAASVPVLRKLLGGSDPALKAPAAMALGSMKDEGSLPVFLAMLNDPLPAMRLAGLKALNRMSRVSSLEAVRILTADPDPAVKAKAAEVVRNLETRIKENAMNDPLYRLGHDAILVQTGGKNIYFDPFRLPDGLPKADLVLVTHDHYDHLSPDDIKKIAGPGTSLVVPKPFAAKAAGLAAEVKGIAAGETLTAAGIEVRAVPAYNPGKKFHPKEYGGVGYFVKAGGTTYYHAGDTDLIPEMKEFPLADVCFLPVSGTYVMTAKEAAEATKILKCKKAVPMHYGAIIGGETDAEEFKKLASCPVEILPVSEPH